jgi:phenylacetate-CoA ligase
VLEVVDADASDIGALLVTTLSNDYMPLLRYRIGDLAQRNTQPYGTDHIVHGRIRDALTTADGTRVTTWQVDQCFVGTSGIAHYQLRQTHDGQIQLRYIPELRGESVCNLDQAVPRLKNLLGHPIQTESVPKLLPESSGKFRLTFKMTE